MLNGHLYAGSSVDMKARCKRHLADLARGKHYNSVLQRAWNKHGADVIKPIMLGSAHDGETLLQAEQR